MLLSSLGRYRGRLASNLHSNLPRVAFFASSPLTVLSEDETMIRQTVQRLAEEKIKPRVMDMDRAGKMDPDVIASLFSTGLMGVEVPQEYGGGGLNFMSAIVTIEELAKVDPSVSVCCDVQNTLVNNAFRFWASPDLKKRMWPRLAQDTVGCFCLSESGSGSDAFSLSTRAEKRGDRYVINGSKMWITNSGEAGIFLVMANLNPAAGYKGITCFVCDKSMKGITVGKREDKLGIRASSTCAVHFDNVEVPEANVLGELGKGYKYAIEILNEGRIGIGAQMIGLAQGVYDVAVPYILRERKQFGSYVGDFQALQSQYAQTATEIEAARLLVYNAARLKEEGRSFTKEAAMAKLYASQVAEQTASRCIEWMGGVGFTKDFPAEKFFRDSKIGSIYEGTSNIQLVTIAKLIAAEVRARN
eukprot:gnl/Spiro4/6238_TR3210_c0_g2_i1.p1 gnl/Spiro4/6238_TR3210_c0_g2~~gnl/Spiro4/6238_TR3210_c0_g2_i1.p1  ORF type:complete len:416 (+),score=129.90 gnl/Spiro4/6238_TR3210_c0_g2_i1:52-1299(+)